MEEKSRMSLVLLVDPDSDTIRSLQAGVANVASTRACCDFVTARRVLTELIPDLMVTNARLGEYNGLHLAYFGKSLGLRTRAIIYADYHDAVLAEEVHSLGAFFELRSTLRHTLAAYLSHGLPS